MKQKKSIQIPKILRPTKLYVNDYIQPGFSSSDERLLVIKDNIDYLESQNKQLLFSGSNSKRLIDNLLKYVGYKGYYACVSNKFFYSKGDDSIIRKVEKDRLDMVISELKPTKILIFGTSVASNLLGSTEKECLYTCGRLLNYHNIPILYTLGLKKCYVSNNNRKEIDDNELNLTNILYYVSRNIKPLINPDLTILLPSIKPSYYMIKSVSKLKKLLSEFSKFRVIGVDIETDNLETYRNRVLTVQFSVDESKSYILILDHKDSPFNTEEKGIIYKLLKKFFRKPTGNSRYLIGHNIGFDWRVLSYKLGLYITDWKFLDTIAGEYLLDENLSILRNYGIQSPYSLYAITRRYGLDFYETNDFSKDDRVNIAKTPINDALLRYMAMDTQVLFALKDLYLKRASNTKFNAGNYKDSFIKLWSNVYSDTVFVMSQMERHGFYADLPYLQDLGKPNNPKVNQKIHYLLDKFSKNTPYPSVIKANDIILQENPTLDGGGLFGVSEWVFNIRTILHQKILFFDVMGLEPVEYSRKTREPSLGKSFKDAYKELHDEVMDFFDLGAVDKINSGFIQPYIDFLSSGDGGVDKNIHASYGYSGVVTGRSNSFKPNLQQVPSRGELSKLIKRSFIAHNNFIKIKGDYATHEIRNWGIVSGDRGIASLFQTAIDCINAYRVDPSEGNKTNVQLYADIHKLFYSKFTGTKVQDVTPEQRQYSKGLSFGSVYGMSINTLANMLGLSVKETQKIVDKMFGSFPGAKKWLETQRILCQKQFYVSNPLGFKRNLFGVMSGVESIIQAMGRRSANSPVQGFSSQLGYIANSIIIRELYNFIREIGYLNLIKNKSRCLSPSCMVHDSTEYEAHYLLFFAYLRIIEWSSVIGVRDYCARKFDFDFNVDLGFDFEIGISGDKMQAWDFSEQNLSDILREITTKDVYKKMYKFRDKYGKLLDSRYKLSYM
jgi:DNA polymerase I-like protein with 3'-5' exonuclease and polymerase domains